MSFRFSAECLNPEEKKGYLYYYSGYAPPVVVMESVQINTSVTFKVVNNALFMMCTTKDHVHHFKDIVKYVNGRRVVMICPEKARNGARLALVVYGNIELTFQSDNKLEEIRHFHPYNIL